MFWLFRALLVSALFCGVILLGLGAVFLQDRPLLEAATPPSAQDVAATRSLVHKLRKASTTALSEQVPVQTNTDQLNSAIRLGARFIPGFRGQVLIDETEVLGQVSVPVPWWNGRQWLNVSGRVPEFDRHFTVSEVTVGSGTLPPDLAVFAARVGANLVMGDSFGDKVLRAATSMEIAQDSLLFEIALDEMGKNGVMRGAFGAMRGNEMPEPEEIENYHLLIRQAMAEGELSPRGSFLPYIRFALQAALERADPGALSNAYTASIFGLAKACGAREFAVIVGRLAFDVADFSTTYTTSCDEITFNGRIDSRRHFVTSAALQAASNTGVSVSIGEFKELYDTISGAGGFDFTDMAANLSGIRMSNAFMTAPAEAWPALIARLETDNDVIVPFEGIPQLMPEAEFKTRFKNVNSPEYKAMLAEIETRIDGLDLHRP